MDATQRVIPYLSYEDGVTAIEWLSRAFGFRERAGSRMIVDGRVAHAEMDTGSGFFMLATPNKDYESIKRHREHCESARRWSSVPWLIDGVLVLVSDLGALLQRANAAGAVILSEIEPGPPAPRFRAEDIEGHRWMFMEVKQ